MQMFRFVKVFMLLPLLAGCTLLFSTPDVQVRDLNVVGLDSKGLDVELLLAVTNPNAYTLKLLGYSYDLKVMALPLAKGGARETFELKGGTTTDLRLPVRVSYSSLYELIKRLPDPDQIPYSLEAGLELDSPFGTHTLPLVKSGTLKVPERYRPELFLKQLKNLVEEFVEQDKLSLSEKFNKSGFLPIR
jgi:LEA14-like dessication related protein